MEDVESKEQDIEIEKEIFYPDEKEPSIKQPYNPLEVDIISQQIVLHNIFDRLENKEIELNPDYQRRSGLWEQKEKSRLIESILIRIPLPTFYFDCRDDNKWVIVDGLQRITALNDFVVKKVGDEKKLYLSDLEYLNEYNGKTYEDLPRQLQRRMQESAISAYCIRPGTPDDITISIFKRINTGGLPLTMAEIRNSVYHGKVADLVNKMASSESFLKATRRKIPVDRMDDRELVTRFISFFVLGYEKYDGNIDAFYDKGLSHIKKYTDDQRTVLCTNFLESMDTCVKLFGDYAFRKLNVDNNRFGPLNKALFECVSVSIAYLSSAQKQKLIKNKDMFLEQYKKIFTGSFYASISNATGTKEHADERSKDITLFLNNFLKECV